ncbi:MAG: O-antigen ligase family protein [Thermodesulfobacteriota bacterium]|nr:O-antigen ligase family protein [Thermodesulfobacteriota bacterium]
MTITSQPFDRNIEGGLCFIIFFSPFAFGSTQVWAYTIIELVSICLITIWFIQRIFKKKKDKWNKSKSYPLILIPISLFIFLILFQLLPVPPQFIQHISPNTYKLYAQTLPDWPVLKDSRSTPLELTTLKRRSLSIHSRATSIELIKILTYIGIFFLVITTIKTRQQIKRIVIMIIITGFLLSLFGIFQYFTWNGKIYWFNELTHGGTPFGPYVNKNHFAGYMVMVIPLAIGFLISPSRIDNFEFGRSRYYLTDFESQISRNILLVFMVIIMIAALFLTLSRGGIMSFLLSMVFLTSLSLSSRRSKKKGTLFLIIIFTFSSLFLIWLGIDPIIDRLSTLKNTDKIGHQRLSVYRDTTQIIGDFPLLGTGLGTFKDIYPSYRTTESTLTFNHAHNDYLEILSDTGLLGGILIIGALLVILVIITKRLANRRNPFVVSITLGGITGIVAMLFHSIADFNMHIPANATMFCIILALTLTVVEMKTIRKRKSKKQHFKR